MIRLSKHLSSEIKICSRREADEWIELGNILVNGRTVSELGFKVNVGDKIQIKNDPSNHVYELKPKTDTASNPMPRLFLANKLPSEILDITKTNNFFSRITSVGAPKGLMVCGTGLNVMCSGVLLLSDSPKLVQLFEHAEPLNQVFQLTCVGRGPPDHTALRWMGSGKSKFGNQLFPPLSTTVLHTKFVPKDNNHRSVLSVAFRGGKFKHLKSIFETIGLIVIAAERKRYGPSLFSTRQLDSGHLCEFQPKVIRQELDKLIPSWETDMTKLETPNNNNGKTKREASSAE